MAFVHFEGNKNNSRVPLNEIKLVAAGIFSLKDGAKPRKVL